jgi:hypothetical protein
VRRPGSLHPDKVGLEAADGVSGECEDIAGDEPHPLAPFFRNAAAADRYDRVVLLDQAVDGERRAPLEAFVFDLGVEGGFACQRLVPTENPHDIVPQARQDKGVIAAAESLDVLLDDAFAHGPEDLTRVNATRGYATLSRAPR